jgi:hypothetical protein
MLFSFLKARLRPGADLGGPRRTRLHCEQLEDRCVPSAIRVVTYNTDICDKGSNGPLPGFVQVLQGIGEEKVQGHAQPIDLLTLEETISNAGSVAPIVSALNSYYSASGAASYAQSSYQATDSGGSANGPNALVYNTDTLRLLASVGVGTPGGSSNGEYRQVVRYEFQPVSDSGSTGVFYVYVSHMKAGTTTADATARGEEATIIRKDEATLPPNASVLYTGDYNSSSGALFTNLTATGQGQAFDPVNFSTGVQYYSESAINLRHRDDYQLMTSNVLNGTGAINYLSGSFHVFGNNGSTPAGGNVNSGSNTALNSDLVQDGGTFISASTLYADLTTATDHLPAVADYTIAGSSGGGGGGTIPKAAHVVVVMEENHSYSNIIGSSAAPYINSLAADPNAAVFTNSFAVEHPSQPNYLDLFSGSNQGVTSDTIPSSQFQTDNLAAELKSAGQTFTGYSEGLPSVGSLATTSGEYARKHNPWSDWQGSATNGITTSQNQPLTALPSNFSQLPTVSFVVPNLLDDMHDGTIAQGDTWLKQNLDSYIQWAKSNNSILILTWDENDGSASNQIPTIIIGQDVKGGQYSEKINHFNVLRTIEDMYGTGHAGASATATPITDIWTSGTTGGGGGGGGGGTSGALLSWDVNGQSNFGTQNLLAGQVASGLTDSLGLTRGSGVSTSGTAVSNGWGGSGWASTSSAGISGGKYLTFGLTVGAGETVSLSAIDLNYRHSSTGPTSGYWQYQLNGGAWQTVADVPGEFSSTSASGSAMTELDLSGVQGLQNLGAGTVVNLRLVPYGATSSAGTWYVYDEAGGDLVLKGTTR